PDGRHLRGHHGPLPRARLLLRLRHPRHLDLTLQRQPEKGTPIMAITILDYVKSVVGDKDLYTAEDCLASGVDILGGCQGCQATIACYSAYPSTCGYWRCADCIGTTGYATVGDFTASMPVTTCPGCGNTDNI